MPDSYRTSFWCVEVTGEESITADFIVGPFPELMARQVRERLADRYDALPDMQVRLYRMNTEVQVWEHFDPFLDMESSASRQHFIDTGGYLAKGD